MNKNFTLASANINFNFGFNTVKPGQREKAKSLVKYAVLDNQYNAIYRSLPVDKWAGENPGKDFWTAAPDTFTEKVLDGADLQDVLENRENALAVLKAINALPYGKEAYNALTTADRAFIILEAHKTSPAVVFDKDITGKVDFKTLIEKSYKAGTVNKEVRDTLRSVVFRIMGEGGELFNGIAPTRSELKKGDCMHFLATFGGVAKRLEKEGIVSTYDYISKAGNNKTVRTALTTLCGVILESRTGEYCKVIRG